MQPPLRLAGRVERPAGLPARCPPAKPPAALPASPHESPDAPRLPAAGTRVLGLLVSAISAPLPLLPHLVTTLTAMLMVGRNSSVCSTPLMTHPLTVLRLRRLRSWLDLAVSLGGERPRAAGRGAALSARRAWPGLAWPAPDTLRAEPGLACS